MTAENSKWASRKQKAAHECKRLAFLFLYLACFFCSFATYNMLMLNDFRSSYVRYSFGLVSAFVIAKVILIGEYAQLGKGRESWPLFLSVLYRAFLFALLALAFHGVEEFIKAVLHAENVVNALRDMRIELLVARVLVVFFSFIVLFAFLELQRRLGEDAFRALIFGARTDRKV